MDKMTDNRNNFIFYEDAEYGDSIELARSMVSFANEFGLSGNLWHHRLAYMLMMHENAFTLACERRHINDSSTILRLAAKDLEQIRLMFQKGAALSNDDSTPEIQEMLSDYVAPLKDAEASAAGRRIKELSDKLQAAGTDAEFISTVREYYGRYGAGKYGMYKAFRVAQDDDEMEIVPVTDTEDITFDTLVGCESQTETLRENTEAFLAGISANNVLLYGDSGTGKSTSIHALMHDYYDRGLRLIEISKAERKYMPDVLAEIKKRNYKFIIFLDDLSFEENESDYKELKAMLEGALEAANDNVIIYATSNRRHLIREIWKDRSDMEYDQDVHRSDTMEEKLSLAGRFGVSIYYPKPGPKEYLRIVRTLAGRKGLDISDEELKDEARKWELRHGGMSGRVAAQLVTWLAGSKIQ